MFNDYIKCMILYHYIIKETKVELTPEALPYSTFCSGLYHILFHTSGE